MGIFHINNSVKTISHFKYEPESRFRAKVRVDPLLPNFLVFKT